SVSCIYSIGKKEEFASFLFTISCGLKITRQQILYKLLDMHYERNDYEFKRGTFRVRGDVIDIIPAYEDKTGVRIELFGDEVDRVTIIDAVTGNTLDEVHEVIIHPAKLFVTPEDRMQK